MIDFYTRLITVFDVYISLSILFLLIFLIYNYFLKFN